MISMNASVRACKTFNFTVSGRCIKIKAGEIYDEDLFHSPRERDDFIKMGLFEPVSPPASDAMSTVTPDQPQSTLASAIRVPTAFPLIVAYYTVGTPYEEEAKTLRLSLDALGYQYKVVGVPNLGTWQKNTQYKATFISEMMEKHPGQPLLYIDVDAVVVQKLNFLENLSCDIAACHFVKMPILMSGTVYFGNTPKCKEIVKHWINLNARYPERLPDGRDAWDQRTLDMAIKQVPSVKFVELPQGYCWVTELTQRQMPELAPVILHTRGSYRFKTIINCPGKLEAPWVVWPTVNIKRSSKLVQEWRDLGYKAAILCEEPNNGSDTGADFVIQNKLWEGFPKAVNALCRVTDAKVVVVAGDDLHPDPQKPAAEIMQEFLQVFPDTFGVMQPTGDRYGSFDTVCVSPWIGRAFIEKVYGGKGPYHLGYYHYFSDQELQEVAILLNAFKQAPHIFQHHDHWQRRNEERPAYLMKALAQWQHDKDLFEKRKKEGFPGHLVPRKGQFQRRVT